MLDDATQDFVRQLREQLGESPVAVWDADLDKYREGSSERYRAEGPGPAMTLARHGLVVVADRHDIPVSIVAPRAKPGGVIVFAHGGGWVLNSAADYDKTTRHLAEATGWAVISVDYRLAPEHPFPAAFEDLLAVTRWACDSGGDVVAPGSPVAVAGDSAGGGLAAAVAGHLADDGSCRLSAQVLVYPALDTNFDRASYTDQTNALLISRSSMTWFWDQYAPEMSMRRDPRAVPLRRSRLEHLPHTVMVLAGYDPLLDEGLDYATRLRDEGVEVDLLVLEDQMHGFFSHPGLLPGAERAMLFIGEMLAPLSG